MTLAPGFDRPVHNAQGVFRTVMEAFSRPGAVKAFSPGLEPPAPLTPGLAAVALTLADPDAPLWLDRPLAASADVREFLRFHTGARIVDDPKEAAFALVSDANALPELSSFAQGTDAYPDRSTTIVVAVEEIAEGRGLLLTGPGVKGEVALSILPEPPSFGARLRANASLFPRGVDLLFVSGDRIAALPRSTQVTEAG